MNTTISTKTYTTKAYRLLSAEWICTPAMIQLAVAQFPFDPDWSIKLLTDGFSLSRDMAEGLVSGAIPYQVIDEAVVFYITTK
jgi:hypothetical protein